MKNIQENFSSLTKEEVQKLANRVDWDKDGMGGLIPVITQDINTKEILMQAFVNREGFENTLQSWNATYWSRSRNEIWEKWLTSWATQIVYDINIDCDRDSITYMVEQTGEVGACHIGWQNSCFETDTINLRNWTKVDIWNILEELYSTLQQRKNDLESWKITAEESYTAKLLDKWLDAILKKVWEEAIEIVLWAKNNDTENTIYEIGDLLYFLNVLMVYSWVQPYQIAEELSRRFWTSWIEEKENRNK